MKDESSELITRFMIINVSSGIAMGMINLIIPIYALSMNATQTEIGLIKGFTGIGDILVVLPAGFLVDYFGSRKMYSLSCITGGIILMSVTLMKTPMTLLLIMVFWGMARTIRTTALSADFFRHLQVIGAKKTGWYKGSMTIGGSFLGPTIGGITAITLGFTNYFLLAIIFLIAPVYIILRGKNTDGKLNRSLSFTDISNDYKNLLKNKYLLRSTLIEGINTAFFMTFQTFMIVLIIKDFHESPSVAASMVTFRGISTILIVFLCGSLIRKDNTNLYLVSFLITIGSLIVLGTGKAIFQFAIGSLILGIGQGLTTLVTYTDAGNVKGEKGKIAGIFSMGHGLGNIFGPIFGGIIADIFNIQTIFIVFIPFFVIFAIYILIDHILTKKGNIEEI